MKKYIPLYLFFSLILSGCRLEFVTAPAPVSQITDTQPAPNPYPGATEQGGVALNPAIGHTDTPPPLQVDYVSALRSLRIRQYPGTSAPVIGYLSHGKKIELLGLCDDNGWRQIMDPDTGLIGWVNASYLRGGCDD